MQNKIYNEIDSNKKPVTIFIGEYYVSSKPVIIATLLGSCVAACLYDPIKRIGGMNHIQMPGRADLKNYNTSARYSINAMELLINGMMKLGADRKTIIAKIFGGASVIASVSPENAIGPEIVSFVKQFLKAEKIKIVSSDLGGINTRKIFFNTDTGSVLLKRSQSMKSSQILAEEQKKLRLLKLELKKQSDTTLF